MVSELLAGMSPRAHGGLACCTGGRGEHEWAHGS